MAAAMGFTDWAQTAEGFKYIFLKPASWGIDAYKESGEEVSDTTLAIRGGFKELGHLMSISNIPSGLNEIGNRFQAFVAAPSIANAARCAREVLGIVSPTYDLALWWNNRIAPVATATLQSLFRINSVALFILSMVKCVEDIVDMVTNGWAARTLCDLGKRVSLVAYASLALLSLATPVAASYFLFCGGADIGFTLAKALA